MYPHERSLVSRLKDEPFALVGVNSDSDRAALKSVIQRERMSWRSFWDGGSIHGPIASKWNVVAWPTVYVLDGEGRIRFKQIYGEDLEHAIESLLSQEQRSPKR
jgi:hypothetical protein